MKHFFNIRRIIGYLKLYYKAKSKVLNFGSDISQTCIVFQHNKTKILILMKIFRYNKILYIYTYNIIYRTIFYR